MFGSDHDIDPGVQALITERADERRDQSRIPCDLEVDYSWDECCHYSFAANMSTGGVYVRTSAPEAPGTLLDVSLKVPGEELELVVRGKVVWFSTYPTGDGPGMAIEFVDLDRQSQRKLDSILAQFRN